MHEKGKLNTDLTVKRHFGTKKRRIVRSLLRYFYHTPSFIISFYHLSQMMHSNLRVTLKIRNVVRSHASVIQVLA